SERTLRVIVETAPSSRSNAFSKFSARVVELGGVVRLALNGGKSAAVEIAGTALEELAADNAVKYISLDRDTKATGHLEITTGASLVRNYGTATTGTIDGHGIGIAVLDSG